MLIEDPQFLHFPCNLNQLYIGILSFQMICFLHIEHLLLGEIIDKFNGNLITTTFIKLPIEEPNANKKKFSTI